MMRKYYLALFFFFLPAGIIYAQESHVWLPVTLSNTSHKTITSSTLPEVSAVSVDSMYFSSHDTLKGFSTSMGRGMTTGVFFDVPNDLFPIVIKSLVVNFYGGSSLSSGELTPADLLAFLWKNVTNPEQIQDTNVVTSSFTQTVTVSVDQYLPAEFDFNDTTAISTPEPFAVGIRYASTTTDTSGAVSPGYGNSPARYNDFYIDSTLVDTTQKAVYYDHSTFWKNASQIGNMSAYLVVETNVVGTGITEEKWHFPDSHSVIQNYPNPFNPQTVIRINPPKNGNAHIQIYNLLGQKVYSLNTRVKAGIIFSFQWAPSINASGIYFVTVSIGNDRYFHKMSYLK